MPSDVCNRLVRMLARHWAAFWVRGDTPHVTNVKTDRADEDIRRAEARRHFWAELRAGQLEAEARCSK